jgi:predicted CxxxxCH...CXXCH cytochrome family protein
MMSFPKVGSKNVPVIFWLFTLTLLFIQAVPAMAVTQYQLDCASCHGMPPLDSKLVPPQREPSGLRQGAFQGNHETHLPAAATPNHCIKCHNNNAYTIDHYNGVINMAARINNYSAVSVGAARYNKPIFFNQTSKPVLSTCSNVNCHFESVTPVWSSAMPGQPADCNLCHSFPPNNGVSGTSHTKHNNNTAAWGGLFGPMVCTPCHTDGGVNGQPYWTYQHASSAGNRGIHFDSTLNYTGTGRNFLPSQAAARQFGSCSNTYCHSNGVQGAGNVKVATPKWGTSATCGSCHASPMVSNGHKVHTASPLTAGCQLCHDATALDSSTIKPNTGTHTNGIVEVTLSTCSAGLPGNNCHGNATPTVTTWKSGPGALKCEDCHMTPKLSVVPTGISTSITAPDKTMSKTSGHTAPTNSLGGPMTGSPVCISCHDATTAHISGVLGDAVRLPSNQPNDNTQCATCHNAGVTKTIARFQNMSTHFTTKGGPQNALCKTCHDPHGTRNIFMLRTTLQGVNGVGRVHLTITDPVNGFVNSTGTGLCQVCHSLTNHYRAGVPEGNNHHTSGCLNCHGHNAAGGAFKPTGGSCDSCHGYPPLPKGLAGLTFGTAGNFANGRFEDYSGGGGAHFVPGHVKLTAVASEGWLNCAKCHNGGSLASTPNHLMLTPVKSNIANVTVKVDQQYRFTDGVMITYTGAKLTNTNNKTGTCTNVECHFQPSRRWSTQR